MSHSQPIDMNAVLLAAIGSTLKDFKASRDKCRAQMAEAIQLGERLGAYIAKAKSHHRSHLTEYLRDTLTTEESKAFTTVGAVSAKRPVISDKVALQCLGLIDRQAPRIARAEPRTQPSLCSSLVRINNLISKSLKSHPVASMSPDEKAFYKDSLRTVAAFYVDICKK